MPRGQSSGHRALAHLLAAHSIATPKQAKEPILSTTLRHMDNNITLDIFIKNFIVKDQRERAELQLKDFKKRGKFTDRLNHQWDKVLDMRFLTKIPSGVIDYAFVKEELKIKETELCYIISNHSDIDGQTLSFDKAFDEVYGRGFGSVIINSASDKIYLETEVVQGKQNRFIGKR